MGGFEIATNPNDANEAAPIAGLGLCCSGSAIAFSPDGYILATASTDRTIKLWSANTGHLLQTLQGHTIWVWAIAFHPHGHTLASASYDQTIKLWNVTTGECLQTLQEHSSSVLAIAFSPDGNWLASGGYDQTIKLWNPATGKCHYIITKTSLLKVP